MNVPWKGWICCLSLCFIVFSTGCASHTDSGNPASPPSQQQVPNPAENDSEDAVQTPAEPSEPDISKEIERMSLDEKLGQMVLIGKEGTSINDTDIEMMDQYKVGGFIFYQDNIETLTQTVSLMDQLKAHHSDNDPPLLLSVDQEGGMVSRMPSELKALPGNGEVGPLNNPELSFEMGRMLAKQLQLAGMNMNFAPVMDVNSNLNNPIIGERSFSSDPMVVSKLGIETMKGMQQEGTISVIKHFPGHGDTSVDSHLELPRLDKTKEQLEQTELVPFQEAVKANADVIMMAHILVPALDQQRPSSLSSKIVRGLLRDELEYDHVVMTDDLTMKGITNHYSIEDAAVLAVQADVDLLLIAHDADLAKQVLRRLKSEVEQGTIPMDEINDSVYRILDLKSKYLLIDEEDEQLDLQQVNQEINSLLEEYGL
ncbi:beta-N-acetylhexosaminidase [Marinicrinis lubricantis]|uniref:Beta-N-acetylhexosaminidase n=1 Tax=Marinicrinis lubricantis TaxID=2086470 RepID=A0ABW1IUA6_9BACL